ncbi:hypothetical protein IYQ92_08970 [Streptococcus sp. HF-1907]|uniref:hypothetical protein n=1 Tax=Streptococcus sp. HF-1907 TaxID=2785793 RepID=UPI00189E352E|nr:hypothetical protein [Streptococcus sp. HF-1907]MBF7095334.1 hypothetical protein [Streptococcus sp. HF-1907]
MNEKIIYFDASTIGYNGNNDREQTKVNVLDESKTPLLLSLDLSEYSTSLYGVESVDEESGIAILKEGLTNNHGELLALFFAMKIAERIQANVICGDSNIAIQYWSKGQYNQKNIKNSETIELIGKVTKQRENFEKSGGEIRKISGDSNPADLGYHR